MFHPYKVSISSNILGMARTQGARPQMAKMAARIPRGVSVPQVPLSSLKVPIAQAIASPKVAATSRKAARGAPKAAAVQDNFTSPWADAKYEVSRVASDALSSWLAHRHSAGASVASVADALPDLSGSSLAADAGINDIGKAVGDAVEAVRPEDVSGAVSGIADAISSIDFDFG
jgi:hypothetical protein